MAMQSIHGKLEEIRSQLSAMTEPLSSCVEQTSQSIQQMVAAAGQALKQASITQAQTQDLCEEIFSALHQQAAAAQTQIAEESQCLRAKVVTVLHEQLSVVQEGIVQRMYTVAQELIWRFEGEASHIQCEVVTMQKMEITALHEEIGQLKLQQESYVCNVEAASTSSATEMQSIIAGL